MLPQQNNHPSEFWLLLSSFITLVLIVFLLFELLQQQQQVYLIIDSLPSQLCSIDNQIERLIQHQQQWYNKLQAKIIKSNKQWQPSQLTLQLVSNTLTILKTILCFLSLDVKPFLSPTTSKSWLEDQHQLLQVLLHSQLKSSSHQLMLSHYLQA